MPLPWLALAVAVPYLVVVVAMGYTRQGVAIGFAIAASVTIRPACGGVDVSGVAGTTELKR